VFLFSIAPFFPSNPDLASPIYPSFRFLRIFAIMIGPPQQIVNHFSLEYFSRLKR
jgi:hypothetical protein